MKIVITGCEEKKKKKKKKKVNRENARVLFKNRANRSCWKIIYRKYIMDDEESLFFDVTFLVYPLDILYIDGYRIGKVCTR